MTTIRAFIAIPLSAELLRKIGATQQTLARAVSHGSVRWVGPEGIHLTLKFLGDTPRQKLPTIEAALATVAKNAPAFTYTVGGTGCFPDAHRPRVIWIGLKEPSGRLVWLQQAVEEALDMAGFPPEGRPFTPHLTLGRVNRRATRSDAAQVGEAVGGPVGRELGAVVADRVALIRSTLRPSGAEYATLAEFRLREL